MKIFKNNSSRACSTAVVRRYTFQAARNNLSWVIHEPNKYQAWQTIAQKEKKYGLLYRLWIVLFTKYDYLKEELFGRTQTSLFRAEVINQSG